MIFDKRTIDLLHIVNAGGEERYKGFEWSEATNAIFNATNDQERVGHLIRRMNSREAQKVYAQWKKTMKE